MTEIITQDRRMQELIALAKTVAASKATVFLQGESGTGKELMASLIHESSNRRSGPFVAINCAAIPENLLESELFGYERGAFTGAVSSKAGKFELAHGGTLLLDEISEMDIRLQAKLLRVLQEGKVDRIGGKKPVSVDVRIIATTNRNISECIKNGLFREDLFYRLNVINLTLPPLRERIGDVRLLAEHFAKVYSKKNKKSFLAFSASAIDMMSMYRWPGNVRELQNVVERALVTCQNGLIEAKDLHLDGTNVGFDLEYLPSQNDKTLTSWSPGKTLDEMEKGIIIEALKYHKGNRTHTAKALGISIRTLRNKIAGYRKEGIVL